MIKHLANIVTGVRALGSILLLFLSVFSAEFYTVYIICGFSDMIDGAIARRTKSTSETGNKIDTAADLVFVTVSLIKILPTINIPVFLWIWGALIAIIKITNIIWGYVIKKHLVSLHTVMNRLTGFLLFILPLTLSFAKLKCSFVVVCSIATFAAIQEWVYIVNKPRK